MRNGPQQGAISSSRGELKLASLAESLDEVCGSMTAGRECKTNTAQKYPTNHARSCAGEEAAWRLGRGATHSRVSSYLRVSICKGRRKNSTSPIRSFVLIISISPRQTIASEPERDANFRPYVAWSTIITAYKVGPDQCRAASRATIERSLLLIDRSTSYPKWSE